MHEPTLLREIAARSAQALASGALEPITSERVFVEEAGVRFPVSVIAGHGRKERANARQAREGSNPFLPYDPELFVRDVSASHVCLLNKFPVLAHHVLLVTRRYEEQTAPLTDADLTAAWACLTELDGVVFYNAGAGAGASQPHRHLQLVPAPLGEGPARTPIDPLLADAPECGAAPALRFRHALARTADLADLAPGAAARATLERLARLRRATGLDVRPRPWNLVLTRDWLLLVPRSRRDVEGIPLNGIGYAGSLFAKDAAQLERLRAIGPLAFLRAGAEALD